MVYTFPSLDSIRWSLLVAPICDSIKLFASCLPFVHAGLDYKGRVLSFVPYTKVERKTRQSRENDIHA